jgi:hypothetical protein
MRGLAVLGLAAFFPWTAGAATLQSVRNVFIDDGSVVASRACFRIPVVFDDLSTLGGAAVQKFRLYRNGALVLETNRSQTLSAGRGRY